MFNCTVNVPLIPFVIINVSVNYLTAAHQSKYNKDADKIISKIF